MCLKKIKAWTKRYQQMNSKENAGAGGVAQGVARLPCKCEALSKNFSTPKKKREREKAGEDLNINAKVEFKVKSINQSCETHYSMVKNTF